MTNTTARALDLAASGVPVFPCNANKAPACREGFKAATLAPATIRDLFAGGAPLIGVPTGALSGFDALDIDPRHGGDAWYQANEERLPVTRIHATRSGGKHVLFKHMPGLRCSTSNVAPGVDVRADGGYIIWWPADGLPPFLTWDMEHLSPWPAMALPAARISTPRVSAPDLSGDTADVSAAVAAIAPTGDWHRWNTVAMAIYAATDGSDDGFAIFDGWSERDSSYEAGAVEDRWRMIGQSPPSRIGMGSLVHLAREAVPGWTPPRYAPTGGAEFGALPPDAPGRRRWLKTGEFDWQNSRPIVIEGLLAERDVGMIFGAPGAGKSLIGPHMAAMVAQGKPFFGLDTEPGLTLYVASEDESGMVRRAEALVRRHGDLAGFHLSAGMTSLVDEAEFARLLDDARTMRPRLIVIDTLAMAFPGLSENEAADMGRVVGAARRLTAWGAAVVLVHHDTKNAGGTPRGHSLLNGALDVALMLEPRDRQTGIISGRLTKNRNGPCSHSVAFRIGVQRLGEDAKGKPVTAAYADEVAAAPPPPDRLSSQESAALEILSELASVGAGAKVSEDDWLARCDDQRVSTSASEKSRRDVIRRVFNSLKVKNRVRRGGGMVWLHRLCNEFDYLPADEFATELTP